MRAGYFGRFETLFDIYSPHPASRIMVLATMAFGAYLLATGAKSGSAVGAIPFVLLVWVNRERFLATLDEILARREWLVLAIPLGVLTARFLIAPPTASDDLLRHIASAFWPGGYEAMYVHTALPPISLYPAFDAVAGALARAIGMAPAMWVLQTAAVGGFVLVFVLAARRLLDDQPAAVVLTLAALVLVLQIMVGRLFLARPEIFMSIWAVAALLVRGPVGTVVWAVCGLILGSGYWLAALYFPAVVLLPLNWRGRVLAFASLSAIWLALWLWLSGGELIAALLWTFEQVANRVPEARVSENMSIVNVVLMPQFLFLVLASLWASGRAGADNRLLLLAGFFLLSNQARYGGIVAPLLALHILSALRAQRISLPKSLKPAAVALGAVAMSLLSQSVPQYSALPRFALPDGAIVLTGFTEATYSTLFANPGRVRVAPAFEIGALDQDVQRLVVGLSHGSLDCAGLDGLGFTHVIEGGLTGTVPDCLSLVSTQANWRLWEVRTVRSPSG